MKMPFKRLSAQKWVLGSVIAILWLAHLGTAIWFVTQSEVIEGRVIERHQHLCSPPNDMAGNVSRLSTWTKQGNAQWPQSSITQPTRLNRMWCRYGRQDRV